MKLQLHISGDLLHEAAAGLFERPGRTILTGLGTFLGVAALVATLGLAATAGNQIVGRLDDLTARYLTIQPVDPTFSDNSEPLYWTAPDILQGLNGVSNATALADLPPDQTPIKAHPYRTPGAVEYFSIPVVAASVAVMDTLDADLLQGRPFDAGYERRRDRVALLGVSAATQLGIDRLDNQSAISIDAQRYLVIGIFDTPSREPALTAAIIIPSSAAQHDFAAISPGRILVTTDLGAGDLIAKQAPYALAPHNPTGYMLTRPPEPITTRRGIETDIASLFVALAGVTLLVGTVGIANTTLVGVLERTNEIGLRRALGARKVHIALQFLTESTLLGSVSGIVGTALGIVTIVAVSWFNRWTPVLPSQLIPLALLSGAVTGLLAGLYPAIKAARLQPADALRAT